MSTTFFTSDVSRTRELAQATVKEVEKEKMEEQRELELLKSLVEFQLGLSSRPPLLTREMIETVVSGRKWPVITVRQLPYILARMPLNTAVLLYGPPGVGKTTGIYRYFETLCNILNRYPIYLEGSYTPEELEELINKVRESPERYLIMSYLKGWDITHQTYAIPELSKMKQVWIVPPKIEILGITEEMINRLLQENPEISRTLLREFRTGETKLYASPVIPRLMRYFPMGVLVIDEALQAFPEFVRQYLMGLAGERHWANVYLSPLVPIILISNPPEYNEAVQQPPLPLGRRVRVYEVVEPTVEDVWNYIVRKFRSALGMEPLQFFYTLMKSCRDLLLSPPREVYEGIVPYPTPAGWVRFVEELHPIVWAYISQGMPIPKEVIVGTALSLLGPEVADRVRIALELNVPPPEQVVNNPAVFENFIEGLKMSENAPPWLIEFAKNRMLLELAAYVAASPEDEAMKIARKAGAAVAKLLEDHYIGFEDLTNFIRELQTMLINKYGSYSSPTIVNILSNLYAGMMEYVYKSGNPELMKLVQLWLSHVLSRA